MQLFENQLLTYKMPIYILIAIDGTGSKEWFDIKKKNSWTWRFYEDFKTDAANKKFWDGPDTFAGNVENILSQVKDWLSRRLQELKTAFIATQPPYKPNLPKKAESRFLPNLLDINSLTMEKLIDNISKDNYYQNLFNRFVADNVEFCLIGHSRGAAMVADIAVELPKSAKFLGLYDSVDRANDIKGRAIWNVKLTYHARRHPDMSSRTSFGYANETADNELDKLDGGLTTDGKYCWAFFKTSHGGIGGDYVPNPTGEFTDYSGSVRHYTDPKNCLAGIIISPIDVLVCRSYNENWGKRNPVAAKARYDLFLSESKKADAFIREGAKLAGIPLG